MNGDAILFRSNAQCVGVNKLMNDLVVCLSLSVSILIDLSPILSFKTIQHFFNLLSSLMGFLYPLLSPFSLSLYTPLPPNFHPPIFFTLLPPPPVSIIKTQFGTVMGICTFAKNSEAASGIQGNLVLSVCNTCHVSLSA